MPPPPTANSPWVSLAGLVVMLMTPLTALAPHSRRSRTADDLDLLDVFQEHVLLVPEDSREQGRIHGPAVDQHQQLVREAAVEAAGADGPLARVELVHLQVGGQPEGLGQAGRAGATDVVPRDDLDGGRGFRQVFGTPRHGADLDGHQLLEAHILERAGRGQGVRSLSRRAGDEDEHAEGSLNWQQSGQETPSSMSR